MTDKGTFLAIITKCAIMDMLEEKRYGDMKVIAVAAVTAGGKTTIVNELVKCLQNAQALHFDNYTFDGEVNNFHQWAIDGADYHVWDLSPLKEDILRIQESGNCDWLILDYPFAYRHDTIAPLIDAAFFIHTPLDVALARHILRDMSDVTVEEIHQNMEHYLQYERIAYTAMLNNVLPSSDYVIDGVQSICEIVEKILNIIKEHTEN